MKKNLIFVSLILINSITFFQCAATKPIPKEKVKYRFFNAYNGYLPVIYNSTFESEYVRADWVLPKGINSQNNFQLPKTKQEAKTRVLSKSNIIDKKIVKEKIEFAFLGLPVSIVILLTFPISVPLLHYFNYTKPSILKHKKKNDFLKMTAGIKCKLSITDNNGNKIKNVRLYEFISPEEIEVYNNPKSNIRSFGSVATEKYIPSEKKLDLMAKNLPISLCKYVEYSGGYLCNFGCNSCDYYSPSYNLIEDTIGILNYISNAFMRYASYNNKNEWEWRRNVEPLNFHYIIWSPGYSPEYITLNNINLHDSIDVNIILDAIENKEKIIKSTIYLKQLLKNEFSKISNFGAFFSSNTIDTLVLNKLTSNLKNWILDNSLPDYFRLSCFKIFESLPNCIERFKGKNKFSLELSTQLIKLEEAVENRNCFLSEQTVNPWTLEEFINDIRKTDSVLTYQNEAIGINELKKWLEYGEMVDSSFPLLNNLRAHISYLENDKQTVIRLSKYYNHYQYFKFFEGGLGIKSPN